MYLILLLVSIIGGVFLTSNLFHDYMNDPKFYVIVLMSILIFIICFISKNGFRILVKTIQTNQFINCLIIVCCFSSLLGLLQYCDIIKSNHSAFPITGTVENPAGFAAIQSSMFPFVFNNCFERRRNRFHLISSAFVSALCFITICLSGSRAGILAVSSSMVIILSFRRKVKEYFIKHKWLWLLVAVAVVSLLLILYNIKLESANGRFFIWKRCFELIKKRPLLGYGASGFHRYYMESQANYFRANPDSPYIMLADNVRHPFNEYIKLLIQFGLIGLTIALCLLFFIVRRLLKCKGRTKVLGLSYIASILTLSQFSYPFSYSVVWLFSFIALAPALIIKIKNDRIFTIIRIIIIPLLLVTFILTLRSMYYEMKWTEITKRSITGKARRMIPNYISVNKVLGNNPLFNYNYAVLLNQIEQYEESLVQANKCIEKWNEYSTQILLASIYDKLDQKEKAIDAYEMAHYMVPCRFEPIYGQFLIYYKTNDTINVLRTAYEITEKPIKVSSDRVSQIIAHASYAQEIFSED